MDFDFHSKSFLQLLIFSVLGTDLYGLKELDAKML